MARNTVTLKVPLEEPGFNTSGCYIYVSSMASTSAASDYTSSDNEHIISLDILPADFIIASFTIPLKTSITKPETDGISYAVAIEETQYSINADGTITDSNFINHLNAYKAANGQFPNVIFRSGSWILKPSSGISYVQYIIENPIVTGTLEGGSTTIFRPSSDISTQHTYDSASYSGAYQLINETVADGDATYINAYGYGDGDDHVLTSTFGLGFAIPKQKRVSQIRIIVVDYLTGNSATSGSSSYAGASLDIDGVIYTARWNNYNDFRPMASYNQTELVLGANSDVVTAINAYGAGTFPNIKLGVITEAYGGATSKGMDSGESRVTQAYVEVVYESAPGFSMHTKTNGSWTQVMSAYQKRNGAWVEITEDECKSILASSFVTK